MNARTEKIILTGCHAARKIAGSTQLVKFWGITKMKHTVKYWDKKLLSLQRLADSVGYDIDNDTDYLSICQLLPVSISNPAPVEILPLFYKVVDRVMSVKNCK